LSFLASIHCFGPWSLKSTMVFCPTISSTQGVVSSFCYPLCIRVRSIFLLAGFIIRVAKWQNATQSYMTLEDLHVYKLQLTLPLKG
jgi:hypothetical protein